MIELISKVVGVWQGAGGQQAEIIYDGPGGLSKERWEAVDRLPSPRRSVQTFLVLDSGRWIALPCNELAHILPDRPGVLVVFGEQMGVIPNVADVSPPHNAVVFNADGSVRFVLQNPFGNGATFRRAERWTTSEGAWNLGVRACPKSYPTCEQVYVVTGAASDLCKQVPRWVPD
jgi:hypothetical protein